MNKPKESRKNKKRLKKHKKDKNGSLNKRKNKS